MSVVVTRPASDRESSKAKRSAPPRMDVPSKKVGLIWATLIKVKLPERFAMRQRAGKCQVHGIKVKLPGFWSATANAYLSLATDFAAC